LAVIFQKYARHSTTINDSMFIGIYTLICSVSLSCGCVSSSWRQ